MSGGKLLRPQLNSASGPRKMRESVEAFAIHAPTMPGPYGREKKSHREYPQTSMSCSDSCELRLATHDPENLHDKVPFASAAAKALLASTGCVPTNTLSILNILILQKI